MAGQAKRDPATQRVACLRDGKTRFSAALPRSSLGGRVKPGHDEYFLRFGRHSVATYFAKHIRCGEAREMREHGGWVYILASKRNGTLYIGVTNDLLARVDAHRLGVGSKFTRKYGVTWLVWFEFHGKIEDAIQRETSIKRWRRNWKLDLIEAKKPQWQDLFEELTKPQLLPEWAR